MTTRPTAPQVETFIAFRDDAYMALDLTGLAAFAMNRLQELHIPVTFENLVVALFRLFPKKFSLEGFEQYPDAARAGRTLLQLGPKYRNWARGSVQKGFVLTESGRAKAAKVASALVTGTEPERPPRSTTKSAPRTMDLGKDLEGVTQSTLFLKWRADQLTHGEARELFDLLGAYAYTPARALRDRLQLLENAAKQLGRGELIEFLAAVRTVFAQYFRG